MELLFCGWSSEQASIASASELNCVESFKCFDVHISKVQQTLTVASVGVLKLLCSSSCWEDVLSIAQKPQWRNMAVFESRLERFGNESILSGRQTPCKILACESRWAALAGHLEAGCALFILFPKRMHHRKADKVTMTDFTVIKDCLVNFVPCFLSYRKIALALMLWNH